MKKSLLFVLLLAVLFQGCTQASYSMNNLSSSGTTEMTTIPATTEMTTIPATRPTSTTQSMLPPRRLSIDTEQEYNALLLAAEKESLYHENTKYDLTFDRYEDFSAFVKMLDKFPVPMIENAKFRYFEYTRESSELYFGCSVAENHWYRFEFQLNQEKASDRREKLLTHPNRIEEELTVEGSHKLKMLTAFRPMTEGSEVYTCWLEIDGWLAELVYRNDYKDFSEINIKAILENSPIKNITELPKVDGWYEVKQTQPTTRPATVPTVAPTTSTTPKATTPKATVEGGKPTIYWTSGPRVTTINPHLQSTQ